MIGEFAVPLMAVMGLVIVGNLSDEAAIPSYLFLGLLTLLIALLVAAGSLALPANLLQALAFAAAGFAMLGHVRVRVSR
ncbi:hypothetical protein [Rhodovarius sp.]|uniref:hypothetical protein n=1 Tax=Rhodovarius sp. TaxID=2972673 RepID=UPI003342D6BA